MGENPLSGRILKTEEIAVQPPRAELEKIVLDALKRNAPEQTPVLAWSLACGPAVAQKTRALSFEKGT